MVIKNYQKRICIFFLILIIEYLLCIIFNTSIFVLISMAYYLFHYIRINDEKTIGYFTMCVVFQNIFLIICAKYINSSETQLIIILKELLIYTYAALYFVKLKKIDLIDGICILFVVIVLINTFFISEAQFTSRIVALRQISIIFACYYFGKYVNIKSEKQLENVFKVVIAMAIVISISGFIIYFLSDDFWLKIGYQEYWCNKVDSNGQASFVNFYTYDILSIKMKRLVSLMADPLAAAHILGLALVILVKYYPKSYRLTKIIIFVAIIMGLSKSNILLLGSFVLVMLYLSIKDSRYRIIAIILIGLMGLMGILFLQNYVDGLSRNTSISNHYNSFISGIKNSSLFGNGLGTAGFNVIMMGGGDFGDESVESFFAVTMVQIGIIGVILVYMFMIVIIFRQFKAYRRKHSKILFISNVLLVFVLIESLFSSSSISMQGTGLYFIIVGLSYKLEVIESRYKCISENI